MNTEAHSTMKNSDLQRPKRTRTWILLLVGLSVAAGLCICVYLREQKGVPFVSRPQIYSIGVCSGPSMYELTPCAEVENPVMTAQQVTDVPADFVADPFVVRHDGTWFMFFEVLNRKTYEGDIALATSNDGLKWQYGGVVLDESFHLSYPQVFDWHGEFYMIPESNRAGSIRLYKAEPFPSKWSFQQSLVMGRYVDPTVFHFAGRWWMFATEISSSVLHLFYSDELEGPWTEHVKSPVVRNDARVARCAGPILLCTDRPLRFAQDCARTYGKKVRVLEITELSTENYEEKEVSDDLLPCGAGHGWSAGGMHQVSFMKKDENMWLACVDGWRWKLRFGLHY